MREWFPMAMHLLEGLFFGMRNSQTIVGERERLLALGSLSAGLTHELNNPAAAAVRATAVLRDRVAGMRHKLAHDRRRPARRQPSCTAWSSCRRRRSSGRANAPKLTADGGQPTPRTRSADWLEEHGVAGGLGPRADPGRRRASTRPGWTQVTGAVGAGRTWRRRCAG